MVRLRRVSAEEPGWTRRRAGRGFVYLDESGERLPDEAAERIRALVIPPAWEDVWICPHENGHLQVVGTDAAGRRQYLYHPEWRAKRDQEKFARVMELGRVLPRVRKQAEEHLASPDPCDTWASALALRLLDLGCFRIGSDAYADDNGGFGLTTLERRHVRRRGDTVVFDFTGKSGIEHTIVIDDPVSVEALAKMRRRRAGFEELLSFKQGRRWQRLTAAMVNEYMRELSGLEVSAKDFRTWHATVLAATALAEDPEAAKRATPTARSRRKQQVAAIKEVAEYLGNTPTVARSSYIDPRVLELHDEGRTIRLSNGVDKDPQARQAAAEKAVLRLLSED
ncbi:DNA topoisomerase IB [Nocardioides luteus]|uniref:DNA topoisomerase n=1 Tax=Nocardioides luteus TaxID=1844 RepID=A0ABQ5T2K7_9ACTN|nr:DNA topoisomerase IB [Nocardioides luteus]MDR7311463.1 DNA topoisomerase IB [Nocardioides luteus]GGR55447.1 DNA topoisomerase [Nocardioides luteus]GLJ70113.1 DNA topoisomerase [Nocardioides luteus]